MPPTQLAGDPTVNDAERLEHMLELVVERVGDPAPRVYERLFEQEPALREMFVLDTQGAARGEMFHRAVETLLDLAKGQAYARAMVEAEWSNHRMNGVSKAQFDAFFELMGQVFREALGADWSTELECSWRDSVARIALITSAAADAA
jgi:hemoglobin-like flavoprotein